MLEYIRSLKLNDIFVHDMVIIKVSRMDSKYEDFYMLNKPVDYFSIKIIMALRESHCFYA
ncbi:Uncharacterised protein [Serratia plymuthica]|nr:Uncharacterised protein [Serratia plymuthica]